MVGQSATARATEASPLDMQQVSFLKEMNFSLENLEHFRPAQERQRSVSSSPRESQSLSSAPATIVFIVMSSLWMKFYTLKASSWPREHI